MTARQLSSGPGWALDDLWEGWRTASEFDALRASGSRFVPGEGQPDHPAVAFVGEAPGAQEDTLGRPFVGPAGQLLDELIEEAGLSRPESWVTNVVKWRPQHNRTPLFSERIASRPWLRQELLIVRPRVIATLGAVPLSLVKDQPITRVHGQPFARSNGRWLYLPLFHPAYLLRRRDLMDTARADFKALARLVAAPTRSQCEIVGPYFPVGDIEWVCRTHDNAVCLRDSNTGGSPRRDQMRCPVADPRSTDPKLTREPR